MSESIKAICILVLLIATPITAVVWFDNLPDATTWWIRIGGIFVCLAALGTFLAIHFRRDVVPDYLAKRTDPYFNRRGFSLAFETAAIDGTCCLLAYFQNQYDQPCIGRISLRPSRGFWMKREGIDTIRFEIPCEPAAFGVIVQPVPLDRTVQGKIQAFEVGASVRYEPGRKKRLRFREGLHTRYNENFKNTFGSTLSILGAMGGAIVWSKPAEVMLPLPSEVAEEIAPAVNPRINTWWKLGDPPLPT